MTQLSLKGLNLPPIKAVEIVHGLSTTLFQHGDTRYRGPVVIRANKTTPPNGQELPDIGYKVVHANERVYLERLPRRRTAHKRIELLPGSIIGSAVIVDSQRLDGGWCWTFVAGRPAEERCPVRCSESTDGRFRVMGRHRKMVLCPVCGGKGTSGPVDLGTVIRRAWFQWEV